MPRMEHGRLPNISLAEAQTRWRVKNERHLRFRERRIEWIEAGSARGHTGWSSAGGDADRLHTGVDHFLGLLYQRFRRHPRIAAQQHAYHAHTVRFLSAQSRPLIV